MFYLIGSARPVYQKGPLSFSFKDILSTVLIYRYIWIIKMSCQYLVEGKNLDKLGSCPNDFQKHPEGDGFFKNGSLHGPRWYF